MLVKNTESLIHFSIYFAQHLAKWFLNCAIIRLAYASPCSSKWFIKILNELTTYCGSINFQKNKIRKILKTILSLFSRPCVAVLFFGTFANFPSWRVQYKHMHTHSPPNVFQLFAKPKHLTVFLSHFLFPKMIYVLKRKLFSHILFATRYRNVHKRKTGQSKKRERDSAKEIGRIYE